MIYYAWKHTGNTYSHTQTHTVFDQGVQKNIHRRRCLVAITTDATVATAAAAAAFAVISSDSAFTLTPTHRLNPTEEPTKTVGQTVHVREAAALVAHARRW